MELWNEEQILLMSRDEVVGLSEWVKRLAQNSIFCSTEFDKRQESVKFQLEELWELIQKEKQRSEDMAKSASDLTKSCEIAIEDLKNEISHHSTENDDGLDHVTSGLNSQITRLRHMVHLARRKFDIVEWKFVKGEKSHFVTSNNWVVVAVKNCVQFIHWVCATVKVPYVHDLLKATFILFAIFNVLSFFVCNVGCSIFRSFNLISWFSYL